MIRAPDEFNGDDFELYTGFLSQDRAPHIHRDNGWVLPICLYMTSLLIPISPNPAAAVMDRLMLCTFKNKLHTCKGQDRRRAPTKLLLHCSRDECLLAPMIQTIGLATFKRHRGNSSENLPQNTKCL